MSDENNNNKNFTIVPNDNSELYAINETFNILHVYIVERVRSFDKQNLPCYMTNKQLAEATGCSEKTISRAINLLIDEKVLWAGYHYETINDKTHKQRILRVFDKALDEYHNKKMQEKTDGQFVQERWTKSLPEMDKMTSSDGQNDPIVYKENIKEYNIKKDEEVTSSLSDSHNTHPECKIFSGFYNKISKKSNPRRGLDEIEEEWLDDVDIVL